MPKEVVYKPSEKFQKIYSGGTLTPPKFMPTFYEWLSRKGEQVVGTKQSFTEGDTCLYTVPVGKTLFLTSAWLSGTCDGAGIDAPTYTIFSIFG